jgi:hypothetical protein
MTAPLSRALALPITFAAFAVPAKPIPARSM